MKKIVRHEAEFGTVTKKQRASMALLVVMLLLAIWLPLWFLSMGTEDMDAVAAGVVILAPSLFYTSLLASASIGTRRMRWGYRVIGLILTAGYLFYFSAQVPDQTASVVLTVAGIGYCLLVDVFSPHCTGKPASWRYLFGRTPDARNAVIETTGKVPDGLRVDSAGDLWGIPETKGSFTLRMWDSKTSSLLDVTYDVTVDVPGPEATASTASVIPAKLGTTTGSKTEDALSKANRVVRGERKDAGC